MNNFNFKRHTNIIFGENRIDSLASEVLKYTKGPILLTYGGGSIKKSGLYDQVIAQLNENNIKFYEVAGIKPNPEIDTVVKGASLIKEHNLDFILAVGGGSVLDNSKHMSIASRSDMTPWELLTNPKEVASLTNLPKVASIITLAGTGSEMNGGGVLTNPEINEKRPMAHPDVVPVFTFEDPTALYTLPIYQKRAGVADMISHLLEVYFDGHKDSKMPDRLVEAILKNIIDAKEDYLETEKNYEACANIFWSATLALNGLTGAGRGGADWASHGMEHEVSAYTDLTHGIGLAIIHPTVLRYYFTKDVENNNSLVKFENLGTNVFGINSDDQFLAEKAMSAIEDLFLSVAKVSKLSEVDITDFDYVQSANKMYSRNENSSYFNFKQEDFENIYKNCL